MEGEEEGEALLFQREDKGRRSEGEAWMGEEDCCLSSEGWAIEEAKRELELLESRHPNRFDYLKLELKAFISQSHQFSPPRPPLHLFTTAADHSEEPLSSSPYLSTQASSNKKQKRKKVLAVSRPGGARRRRLESSCTEDKVELAMKKAEACLRQIHDMKRSFLHAPP